MRCARSLRALQVAPWVNKEIAAAAEHPLARSIQDLAIEARQASAKNLRDPFLWQGIRLRARSAAPVLHLHHVAAFLGSSVKVGLVDEAFLIAMAGRLDTLLRWGPSGRRSNTDMIICCNAFLRVGLDLQSPIYEEILGGIAGNLSCLRPFEAALLASCLARMRRKDSVLLRGVQRAAESSKVSGETVLNGSMVLQALAILEPHSPPEDLSKVVENTLHLWWIKEEFPLPMSVLQRSLLSLVQAEVAWIPAQEQPSALMNVVAEYLAGPGGHGLWPVRALPALATALRRWGQYSPAMSKVARRLLRVLQLRLSRPCRKGLSPALLLECFCAALPLAPESREPIHRILHYLLPRASDLRPGQLVALVEQCAVAWEGSTEEDRKALQASVSELRSVVYRRLRDIPLKVLPRALAALLQMASKETIESEFWPLLRRSTGRLAYKLREVLDGGDTDTFDVDALGEVFYVCAASGYSDDAFLEASEAWLLKCKAELKVPLTLVHLLHSAAVLHVAKGPLLHLLVAASIEQMENFGAFEVLGFLDAASLLQRQADQAPPMVMEFQKEGPPPSGVGEQGLQASLERLGVLMPTLDDDDLQHFLALLTAMRLPEGLANPIYQEAADRGLLESKSCHVLK